MANCGRVYRGNRLRGASVSNSPKDLYHSVFINGIVILGGYPRNDKYNVFSKRYPLRRFATIAGGRSAAWRSD